MRRIEIVEVNNGWVVEKCGTSPNMASEVIAVFNEIKDMKEFIEEYFVAREDDFYGPIGSTIRAGGRGAIRIEE